MTVPRRNGTGLLAQDSTWSVDFGTGHNQAARGDSVLGSTVVETYLNTAGAAVDYTADANYNPTAEFPDDASSVTSSGRLGGTATVPHFWVLGRNFVSALALRTDGSLRLTANGTGAGDCLPVAFNGANVVIPLGTPDQVTVEFTLSTNLQSVIGGGAIGGFTAVRASLARAVDTVGNYHYGAMAAVFRHSTVAPTATAFEYKFLTAATPVQYAAEAAAAYESSGVYSRRLRFVFKPPVASLWGAPAGGTTLAIIKGRRDGMWGLYRRDMSLAIGIAPYTGFTGVYAQISNLVITKTRL